jgi:hypothetical protein
MRAIEINARIDNKGFIQLEHPLGIKEKKVKLIILMEEDSPENENSWLKAISSNPAFSFLNEPDENIYTANDGKDIEV